MVDYNKRLVEVDEILNYLSEDDLLKISEDARNTIKENMDKQYVWKYDETKKLKEQNLTDTQVERYKKLLEDQYRNLTYEIKNEKIDGDHAIVTVQIEVIDYKKSISDLTYDSTKYTKESYDDAKLDLLEKAKDKVTYTLELGVTKDKNNNWRLDSLSNADIKKIQGMY